MALVKCKECGKNISDEAEACPHCGKPRKSYPTQYGCGTLILLGFIVIVFVALFSQGEDRAAEKDLTQKQKILRGKQKTDALLAELKIVPVAKYEKNKNLYKELV